MQKARHYTAINLGGITTTTSRSVIVTDYTPVNNIVDYQTDLYVKLNDNY